MPDSAGDISLKENHQKALTMPSHMVLWLWLVEKFSLLTNSSQCPVKVHHLHYRKLVETISTSLLSLLPPHLLFMLQFIYVVSIPWRGMSCINSTTCVLIYMKILLFYTSFSSSFFPCTMQSHTFKCTNTGLSYIRHKADIFQNAISRYWKQYRMQYLVTRG